jgi:subtilisin family serine protease
MACGGITLPSDFLYNSGSVGPAAWEDILLYDVGYPFVQNPSWWDFPYGGFGGAGPGLLKPDMVGYTTGITTTNIGTGYTTFGGTSAATPHLGGAMCLLVDSQPLAQPRHIAAALEFTAIDLGPVGKDNAYGSGKIAVFDAARRLRVLVVSDNEAPSIGTAFSLDVYGAPNAPTMGWVGLTIADDPTAFNLVLPNLELGLFALDGSGQLNLPLAIPANPLFVGLTAWFQFGTQVDDAATWGPGLLMSVPEPIRIQL